MAQFSTPMPNAEGKIRVLAADSTRMSSQLLAQALAQNTQFHVTGVDPQPASILAAVADEKPHVVVMSSVLNESTSGFDVIREVCSTRPETHVVMLMDTSKRSDVVQAFRSGVHGVFSRTESPKLLAKCICSVHEGQVWANSAELRFLLEDLCESESANTIEASTSAILSKREQDVVRCLTEGLSNREIANRLGLTEHTVKNYLFRIFDKLGLSSRVEVVLYAFRFRKELVGSSSSEQTSIQGAEPTSARPFRDQSWAMSLVRANKILAPTEESRQRIRA